MSEPKSNQWYANVVMGALNKAVREEGIEEVGDEVLQGLCMVISQLLRDSGNAHAIALLTPFAMAVNYRKD